MRTVCICGGGALGHVMIGSFSKKGYIVNLLTNHPKDWNHYVDIETIDGKLEEGYISIISNSPQDVIPQSDLILFCLPGFLIRDELKRIKEYLSPDSVVGSIVSSTGFFIMALDILGPLSHLFGFQRVPYIARVKEYGKSAYLLGYKSKLKFSFHNLIDERALQIELEILFDLPVEILEHVLEATLTNSNPILHPTRLYTLFSEWTKGEVFTKEIYFYEDWDINSSKMLIACDNEFQEIVKHLPVNIAEMQSLLDYYESSDAKSLTNKITSIKAFEGIKVPMIRVEGGYVPDFSNRYFTEDIPYGLILLKYIASIINIPTPNIDRIINWSQKLLGMDWMHHNELIGNDLSKIGCLNKNIILSLIR